MYQQNMYEIQVEIHLPPLLFNFSRICGRCTVQYRTETCNGTTETVLKKRQRVHLWNGHQEIFTLQSFQQRETISKKIFLWPETFLSAGGRAGRPPPTRVFVSDDWKNGPSERGVLLFEIGCI
jgi:hypothetical protein